MIDKNNLTIIVQGIINPNGLRAIPNYLNYGKVILSSIGYKNFHLLKELGEDLDKIKLIIDAHNPDIKYRDRNCKVDNDGNIYVQTLSVLNAAKLVDTEYFIKFRADELYTNLNPLLEKMESGKFISSCRYARRNRNETERLYHLGDTFFGGKSDILLKSFTLLKKLLEDKYFHTCKLKGREWLLSAEQKIYISIIKVLEPDFSFDEATNIMYKYFDICPLNSMAPFIINSHDWLKDFGITGKDYWNPIAEDCITNINQI